MLWPLRYEDQDGVALCVVAHTSSHRPPLFRLANPIRASNPDLPHGTIDPISLGPSPSGCFTPGALSQDPKSTYTAASPSMAPGL
ncbi:unnamed protein product [Protopolystoma xenopodis]|uniref:Uncharacterized protein n=1 Tax=Protopolystoma xenopodis TaxID=117903 RepID=A0A448XCJ8_9PLAT|nr:unnamed protein product [Protopolystoma xenopodis]